MYSDYLDLLLNPRFDGSTRAWEASLGSRIGLIPLFFPAHDKNFKMRKLKGKFHEHISGRKSAWAARNRGSQLDRNYACFLMAPPTTNFDRVPPVHSVSQTVSVDRIPIGCRQDNGSACLLLASAWIRVDKLWGDREKTLLFLSVRLLDSHGSILQEHRHALDPFLLEEWQYTVVQQELTSLPPSVAALQFTVGLNAQVGSIYVDDTYLSVRPLFHRHSV